MERIPVVYVDSSTPNSALSEREQVHSCQPVSAGHGGWGGGVEELGISVGHGSGDEGVRSQG